MPDHDSLSDDDLQFDRAVTELPASIALVKVGVTCEACKKSSTGTLSAIGVAG